MIREFPDGATLADALAAHVAVAIARGLARQGRAAIALSGGATPVRFFRALSRQALDWASVTVTLVDDRWVPETSPRSNAGTLRQYLLNGAAREAVFLPLVDDAATPEAGRAAIEARISALPLPFAAVVLGMGADGHTASFFPGGDRLAEALNPVPGRLVETMRAEAAAEPRVTLTLPVLLQAETLALHIEGAAKRKTLEAAMQPGPVEDMPIRAVLAKRPSVEIFWSP